MWNRLEFKARGKEAFRRNYGAAVAVALLMGIISMIFSGNSSVNSVMNRSNMDYQYSEFSTGGFYSGTAALIATILGGVVLIMGLICICLQIFVENLLIMGGKRFFILNQTTCPSVGTILDGFKSGHYGNIVLTMFLRDLFTGLWSLLLVVPGIVKHYEYLMVPYILAENPGMDQKEIFKISKEMMNGHKMDAFILDLSFLGWDLLSVFTCGILSILYVGPYKEATLAEVYAFNKQKAFEAGYIR